MKKTVFIMGMVMASSVMAESITGFVEDHKRVVEDLVPHSREECRMVDVPIYGSTATSGDRIAGAIIGGIIGNQFGKGTGNTAATVIGSVVGSEIANSNNVVGYKRQQTCEVIMEYTKNLRSEYSHSTVQFEYEGEVYRLTFTK